MTNNYTFTISNFNILYPRFILNKNKDKYYDFRKVVLKSNYSRTYQLNNRSIQSIIFDKLIELNHFNLLGINETILKEFVLINTDLDNDKTRSYYLLDYFIPSKSLCIELDSDLHEELKDKLKDKFLNSLNIKVLRIKDFNIDTKNKLEVIVNFIQSNPYNEFKVDYSELIEEYEKFIKLSSISKLKEKYGELYFIKRRWIGVIEKLCNYDNNLRSKLINNETYIINITLSKIFEILPMSEKKVKKYYPLMRYLRILGIELNIKVDKVHNNQYTVNK